MNTLAFERRCIHTGCVPLPRSTTEVRLGRAPCRSGASTLSVLNRIHGTGHYQDLRTNPGGGGALSGVGQKDQSHEKYTYHQHHDKDADYPRLGRPAVDFTLVRFGFLLARGRRAVLPDWQDSIGKVHGCLAFRAEQLSTVYRSPAVGTFHIITWRRLIISCKNNSTWFNRIIQGIRKKKTVKSAVAARGLK